MSERVSTKVRVRDVERIGSVHRPSALRALFTVEVEGVARISKCRYIEGAKGSFVTGPSFHDGYTAGGWAQPVDFDPEVADVLLETVRARLAQDTVR